MAFVSESDTDTAESDSDNWLSSSSIVTSLEEQEHYEKQSNSIISISNFLSLIDNFKCNINLNSRETFEVKIPQDVACFDCKGSGKTGEGKLDCIKCKGIGKFAASNYIVWIRKVAKNSPFIHKVIAFPAK